MSTYLGGGFDRAQMGRVFHAAAQLWRAAPWNVIATDECLVRISSESLGLRDAVVSVVGQHRTVFGFLLFPGGVEDFAEFGRQAGAIERGLRPATPRHLALNYLEQREIPASSRREIASRRWEIASPAAYPIPAAVDRDPHGRQATDDELVTIECVALLLAELVATEPRLGPASFGADSFERAIVVESAQGPRAMTAGAPCVPPSDPDEEDDDQELVFVDSPTVAAALSPDDIRKAKNRAKAARRRR